MSYRTNDVSKLRELRIKKRDGSTTLVDLVEIRECITRLTLNPYPLFGEMINNWVEILNAAMTMMFIEKLNNKTSSNILSTSEIDAYLYDTCVSLTRNHPHFNKLAVRVWTDDHCKTNGNSFSDKMNKLQNAWNKDLDKPFQLLDNDYYEFVQENSKILDSMIDYNDMYRLPSNALEVLNQKYLTHRWVNTPNGIKKELVESPLDLYMRIAVCLAKPSISEIGRIYSYLAKGYISCATPIQTRSGMARTSLASCYLLTLFDSTDSITNAIDMIATMSRDGGGIAVSIMTRVNGAYIAGSNGHSNGALPYLKMIEATAMGFNQGDTRSGAIAVHFDATHEDGIQLMGMRDERGNQSLKVPTLFPGVVLPGEFMRRVMAAYKKRKNPEYDYPTEWHTFSPHNSPELFLNYGEEYDKLYAIAEKDYKRICNTHNPLEVFTSIIGHGQSGGLFVSNKDFINVFHPLNLYGPIFSPNLCTEVILPTLRHGDGLNGPINPRDQEAAVCTLSSVCIPTFVIHGCPDTRNLGPSDRKIPMFDYGDLKDINTEVKYPHDLNKIFKEYKSIEGYNGATMVLSTLGLAAYATTDLLNYTIDSTRYPKSGAKKNHEYNRPIGVSQQGFADACTKMGYSLDSQNASELNVAIAATIYYFVILSSADMARKMGKPFPGYQTSQWSKGKFQFDLRNDYIRHHRAKIDNDPSLGTYADNKFFLDLTREIEPYGNLDWDYLREYVNEYGVYNGTMTTLVPGESNSKSRGNSEMCEPRKGSVYTEKTTNMTRYVYNPYFIQAMEACGYLNNDLMDQLERDGGSVQNLNIPAEFKKLFMTIYEIPQSVLLKQTIGREPYIDMSQSYNIYLNEAVIEEVAKLLMYAYRNMVKCPCYYIRTKAGATLNVLPGLKSKGEKRKIEIDISPTETKSAENNKRVSLQCTDEVCLSCT